MLYRPNKSSLYKGLCIALIPAALLLQSCAKEATAVQEIEEPLEVHDIMMPAPPKQNVSEELKKAIDKETEREWHADDPVEEPVIEEYPIEEVWYEPEEYIEEWYEESTDDFQSRGVIYADGIKYTWYSQNVLPGNGLTELNNNGRTVNERGFVVDGDGYVAIASSDYEQGTVLDTPFGPAKVYDSGCDSGVIDIYTDF